MKPFLFNFTVDKKNKTIKVDRSFYAPRNLVWSAWTQSEILDQWWAPKPWKAETKSQDFSEGGHWLYAMVGPRGEKHWARVDYLSIEKEKHFSAYDGFSDDNGVLNSALPRNKWENDFVDQGENTIVHILLSFESLSDLETIIDMGFKEGFTSGLENLDAYIEKVKK